MNVSDALDQGLFDLSDTKTAPAPAAPLVEAEAAAVVLEPEQPVQPVVAPLVRQDAVSPSSLLRIAMDQGTDLDRMERLLEMQERWEKREAEKAYNAAFAAFKAEEIRIVRSKVRKEGPLKGQAYAELSDYVDAITPALSRYGLSASWKPTRDEKDWIEVTCTLKHVGGHFETASMGGAPDTGPGRNAIQARASAVKYLERYTLQAVCGVADVGDDDDGNGGGAPAASTVPMELLTASRNAAMGGWKSFSDYVQTLTVAQRESLKPEYSTLKAVALRADKAKEARP